MPSAAAPVVLLTSPALKGLEPQMLAEGWEVARWPDLDEADRGRVRAAVHIANLPFPKAEIETLPSLGLIHCLGAGYDGVDVPWCRARGVEVTNGAGVNADDVADYAIGMMLAAWRRIADGDRMIRDGRWVETYNNPAGPSLSGRRLGIVGLGYIGAAAARRAEAFGLEPRWWGPRPKPAAPWPRAESLLALAGWCDILLVACRAHEENRGLVSREVIEAVGPQGMIVNVARGSVVDEDALIAALKAGRLGRAALDVFLQEPTPWPRWRDVPNVLLTPHGAGATTDIGPRLFGRAMENLRLFLAGRPVATPVPLEA
jgi:lactate dehydrogenase-like 2-hydroxyacid dehydrogenase